MEKQGLKWNLLEVLSRELEVFVDIQEKRQRKCANRNVCHTRSILCSILLRHLHQGICSRRGRTRVSWDSQPIVDGDEPRHGTFARGLKHFNLVSRHGKRAADGGLAEHDARCIALVGTYC